MSEFEGAPRFRGWTMLFHDREEGSSILPTAISCEIGKLPLIALVDTGATYSLLSPALKAGMVGVQRTEKPVTIRHGEESYKGQIYTVPLRLIADEGEDFELEAKFCVSDDWTRRVPVLGVKLCLDQLNLAFAPATEAGQVSRCYFGKAGEFDTE